ncbi:unnamed protein product [Bursaphelenchus okinawaensis]|uniref:THIF-type NAD/FAD binding fold domain-containing protein n=1 Tax=Bursaphelenchus okinawaensis TaxID=465554 RepID=A0A811KVQ4_9BILA|nr:unnamed protein product [Bursaphelenchus okinawaensis]CAG9112188.1 unnamed protein product [Bursaphelenchus okinawaensis]
MSSLSIKDGNSVRHHKQIRLWGDRGQHSLGRCDWAIIGSSATSTEILECLVFAGIRSFTIFVDEHVGGVDFGSNFFITQEDTGRSRAEVVTKYIKELNPAVEGRFEEINFKNDTKFNVLEKFSIVIGCGMSANVSVQVGLSLGLLGFMRICVGDHEVHNAHTENVPFDFRIWNPFPALKEYADNINLDELEHEQHSHIPYLLLYIKALPEWRKTQVDPDALPTAGAKKKSFITLLKEMQKPNNKGILDEVNFQEACDNIYRSSYFQSLFL